MATVECSGHDIFAARRTVPPRLHFTCRDLGGDIRQDETQPIDPPGYAFFAEGAGANSVSRFRPQRVQLHDLLFIRGRIMSPMRTSHTAIRAQSMVMTEVTGLRCGLCEGWGVPTLQPVVFCHCLFPVSDTRDNFRNWANRGRLAYGKVCSRHIVSCEGTRQTTSSNHVRGEPLQPVLEPTSRLGRSASVAGGLQAVLLGHPQQKATLGLCGLGRMHLGVTVSWAVPPASLSSTRSFEWPCSALSVGSLPWRDSPWCKVLKFIGLSAGHYSPMRLSWAASVALRITVVDCGPTS